MRYRQSFRKKWFYPFILCGLLLFGAVVIDLTFLHPEKSLGLSKFVESLWELFLIALFFFATAVMSWIVWTNWVDVDESGIRWEDEGGKRSLKWDEISHISLEERFIALVMRDSGHSHPLPFMTRELYRALKPRVKPLTPADEEKLYSRC